MKKVGLLLCLLLSSVFIYAQKSYITMRVVGISDNHPAVYLSGDIPDGIDSRYNVDSDTGAQGAKILNRLSEYGYEVEQMLQVVPSSTNTYLIYLLAKKSSSSPSYVQQLISDDKDITEVARYNLQGMPVYANEKGIQIIVYSNYTTKTVIVQ